jgi:antitoxin PrlF
MSTLTSKGQVTLPKTLRDRFGLKAGSQVEFALNAAGEIVVKPVAQRTRKSAKDVASQYRKVLESLRGTADQRFASTDEYMKFIRG